MVPPSSDQVSRVWPYSGTRAALAVFIYVTLTLFRWPSHAILLNLILHIAVQTPKVLLLLVWPPPRSLATTSGISVDFSSSPYLDVSVQAVPLIHLCIQCMMIKHDFNRIAPFGNLRINAYLRLPVAYRS